MNRRPTTRPLKITVVGDGTVGKTCLLMSYTKRTFQEKHVPTVFDNHSMSLNVDNVEFPLTLWDTAGQEEYEKLRRLSYPKTDCFIVCYAVNNRASFNNIVEKWVPELRYNCRGAAIILVETKCDLKNDGETISESEARKLKSKIKASNFLQCSAKTREGVEEVFIEAVRAVMRNSGNTKKFCKYL